MKDIKTDTENQRTSAEIVYLEFSDSAKLRLLVKRVVVDYMKKHPEKIKKRKKSKNG